MEILFVSHKYPPAIGGMEKQSFELIENMEAYTTVHKIVYKADESILKFFFLLNRRIRAMLKKHPNIKLIHFNDGLLATFSLYHHGYDQLKKVVTIHGLDIVFPLGYFQRKIIPKLNRFDKIIAVSRATREAAIARGIQANKIEVILNGVDHHLLESSEITIAEILTRYQIDQKAERIIVALGRSVKRKGISWFIKHVLRQLPSSCKLILIGPFTKTATWKERLFYLLPPAMRHLLFLFLGYPSDERAIRHYLSDPHYSDKLQHIGKIPLADLQCLLRHTGLFIMPNIQVEGDMEGFGLVCLEASICGATVFAADIEGIRDAIVDYKNGFLLPSEEASVWVDCIHVALENPSLLKTRSEGFQQYSLQHYSWDKMTQDYFTSFQVILGSFA
ncbi:glycosyltransferase family 4 protein [Sphingobacterium sp. SRCM116780]|uniref:glycosyltransferase family 4 protein n=1 Tax=Sphingobacterium sp. SRCM116780 TaxID=2907623 RepID=UPI001F2FDE34|nr:glycosyltransferase family 4 protein [Sphingobacterium sp. SRCM116780]UIR55358.1 glycosyltransferase family 4 protein [Sphingobacterium sp. SRCM116780]